MKPKNTTIFVYPLWRKFQRKTWRTKARALLSQVKILKVNMYTIVKNVGKSFFFMDNYSIFYSKVGAGGDGWLRLRNTAGCSWATSSVHEHWAFHRVGLKLFLKIKYYIFLVNPYITKSLKKNKCLGRRPSVNICSFAVFFSSSAETSFNTESFFYNTVKCKCIQLYSQ